MILKVLAIVADTQQNTVRPSFSLTVSIISMQGS